MVTPSVGQCGPHRSSHSGHLFPTAISGSSGTYLSDAILFVFACKHLNGVKRQLSQIYGYATCDLNVKVISYWFYPKCHRRAHLVDHQRHTMPTGAGLHDTGLLLFTDRNKHHMDTRHLDKVDKYFFVVMYCISFGIMGIPAIRNTFCDLGPISVGSQGHVPWLDYLKHRGVSIRPTQHRTRWSVTATILFKRDVVLYQPNFQVNSRTPKSVL